MANRNRHKRGDWLAQDDESGLVHYASEMVRRWDGMRVHRRTDEPIPPQWFIRAKNDPKPLSWVRPEQVTSGGCPHPLVLVGGNAYRGPWARLFLKPLGEMQIGCNFVVYPDGFRLP
jgi:hypothetical protein